MPPAQTSHIYAHHELTCNILVLQEDDHLAALLQYLLEREGYGVHIISDIGDAILYIQNAAPMDLIMVDESWLSQQDYPLMPILRNYPQWHTVPTISLMKNFSQNEIDRALHAGVTDYLVQPYEPGVLLDQIQKYTT
jgi:PleD family two-component response regulator